MWPAAQMLCGTRVTLFPLTQSHASGLSVASRGSAHLPANCRVPLAHDLDGEISYLREQQADGRGLYFAVSNHRDTLKGIAGFSRIDRAHKQVEIGGIWVQGTDLLMFTEMLTMLFTYAFECAQAVTVQIRAPAQNQSHRLLLSDLGAQLDGVLRGERIDRTGHPVDMAVYSIIATEWPQTRKCLLAKLL
ncbi:MAG: GNAT family N-acetyltransferase [Cognatishimia sp.]